MSSFEGRREYTREHNRLLNDALRRWSVGGDIFVTQTVRELPINEQSAALEKLSEFNNFNECNDPTGEHDFGVFESNKKHFVFKISYPKNRDGNVVRTLVLMLSSEW